MEHLSAAHGLLLHLAMDFPDAVWKDFRSWMRTMDTTAVPSEDVVADALRQAPPEYLLRARGTSLLCKMICENIDPGMGPAVDQTGAACGVTESGIVQ